MIHGMRRYHAVDDHKPPVHSQPDPDDRSIHRPDNRRVGE